MKRFTAMITCCCLIVVSGCAGFATAPATRVEQTEWPGGESHRHERTEAREALPGPEISSAPVILGNTLTPERPPVLALGLLPPADVPPVIEENPPKMRNELAYAIVAAIGLGIAWYTVAHDNFNIEWSRSD